jgi:hypothetical protein
MRTGEAKPYGRRDRTAQLRLTPLQRSFARRLRRLILGRATGEGSPILSGFPRLYDYVLAHAPFTQALKVLVAQH